MVPVMTSVREIFCALHGHEHMLQFQQDRMFLRCFACGHESSGWRLNRTATRLSSERRRSAAIRPLASRQL